MTWAYLGGDRVQVDLFTVRERTFGGLAYVPSDENETYLTERMLVKDDAVDRGERRAVRLFETAPPPPDREPRFSVW
jgi:hypothetical protein